MQAIFTNYDIYLFDYEKLFAIIMKFQMRLFKIQGLNTVNLLYKQKEIEHIQMTLDLLNCEFLKRYNYLPIFAPL
jgi:hypothetical protein